MVAGGAGVDLRADLRAETHAAAAAEHVLQRTAEHILQTAPQGAKGQPQYTQHEEASAQSAGLAARLAQVQQRCNTTNYQQQQHHKLPALRAGSCPASKGEGAGSAALVGNGGCHALGGVGVGGGSQQLVNNLIAPVDMAERLALLRLKSKSQPSRLRTLS